MENHSFNEHKYINNNPLMKAALASFFRKIVSLIPQVETVFDAGCGEGYAAREILQAYPDLTMYGCDLSLDAVRDAATICPALKTCVSDVTRLPLPGKSVDLVISLEVLEHLPHPELAIQAYKQLSRRYLLLSVPNEPIFRLQRMLRGLDIRQFGDHPEHLQHWSLSAFESFLNQQGLETIHQSSPFPFSWSIVLCQIQP